MTCVFISIYVISNLDPMLDVNHRATVLLPITLNSHSLSTTDLLVRIAMRGILMMAQLVQLFTN